MNGSPDFWECRYDFPAVTDRYVSYDGVTEALHQHFAYSTTWSTTNPLDWTQKSTTVTNTDNVRVASYSTQYGYTPLNSPFVPNCTSCLLTEQVPVEGTTTYNDYSGAELQTVTKSWKNVRLVQSVQTTLYNSGSSLSSLKVYCYNSWEEPTEVDEYDFGTGTPSGSCASPPSSTASGSLLRKTTTSYASFAGHIVDKPSSVISYDGSGNRVAETDYTTYDSVGNLQTKVADCFAVTGGQPCAQGNSTTSYVYDSHGQTTKVTDPDTNPTQYSYTDSYSSCGGTAPIDSPSDAYVTQITYPNANNVTHAVNFCYDYTSGLLLSSTDENGNTTKYTYADPFDRLTSVSYPDGGATNYSYSDAGPSPTMTTTSKITSSQNMVNVQLMNGLYTPYETELTSDPGGTDYQLTKLDGSGMAYQAYNPYRTTSDPTYAFTTYTYDASGRTTTVAAPLSSTSTIQYALNCTTTTDPSSHARKWCVDGLGRTTSVFEDPAGLNYEADYTYDGNSNLTRVDQWGGPRNSSGERARTFSYDSLSHLVSATNPESGNVGYTYDPAGNLMSKTNALSYVVSYQYDSLNRETSESTTGPLALVHTFNYDQSSVAGISVTNPVGNLTSVAAATPGTPSTLESMTIYSNRDQMERVKGTVVCTPASCNSSNPNNSLWYTLSDTYDLAGDLTSYTNGFGTTISSSYDGSGRLSTVYNGSTTLAANTYSALGLTQSTLGNGVVDALAYDKLARLLSSTAKNASNQTIYSEAMTTYFPNGNPNAVADSVNGTWTYNYDTLNRLTTAVSSTTGQGCQFGYDAFGNRTQEASYEGSCYTQNFTFTGTTTNRVDGYCYDAAGNLLDAGPCSTPPVPNQNLYDGFGNMISGNEMNADPTTYTVDALGNRVAKSQNGIIQRQYLYSIDGNPVAEMDGSGGLQQTDVRAGGQFLAEYRTAGLYYLHKDHLGTIRAESTPAGTIAVTCTSLPFGDGQTCTGTADPSGYFFTGKERDTESGNDYFGARYYASSMGRFMSPDPGWFMEADPTNPQTWNLYSYALNNPLKLIDPTGMDQCIWDDGTSDDRPEDGGATQQECADQGGNWASDTDTTITVTPQSTDPKPSCSDFTGPAAPPAGPINYRQQAQSNSQKSLPGLFQAFKTGGSQDFKGNPAFGNRTNQINAGNFNFGATMAAMGKTLNGAAFWAGVGAELSNAQTQVSWAAGQVAATPPVPYPVNTGIAPSPAPASTVGPGSPGSPTYAPNTGLMNQGDQDATNENQAVALGFVWYSMGCTQ
jgi:RHS repeat-associated protein